MKKEIIYSIFITVFLVIIAIIGSTYAYYSLTATGNNTSVSANSEKYEIVYRGGTNINSDTCQMDIVANKEQGCSTVVEIGIAEGVNVTVNANLFINIESISNELKVAGFKWEVWQLDDKGTENEADDEETFVSNGNFSSIPNNNQIPIVANTALSTTLKKYKIYLWIDGNLTGNSVAGKSFNGYIGASTEILTGIVNNS